MSTDEWAIDEPPDFYGISAEMLISLVPASGYRSILLPKWFPLERAPRLKPAEQEQYLGFWRWDPVDALSMNAQPPQWCLGSPWAVSAGVDYDDPRALAPDATLEELRTRTQELLGASHTLTPRTYHIAWGEAAESERPTWVDLPLLAISRS